MYDNPGASCCDFEPNQVQREVEYVKMYPMMLAIKKVVLANPNPTVTLALTLTLTLALTRTRTLPLTLPLTAREPAHVAERYQAR